MNFLADMGVSMTTVAALRHVGHNSTHLRAEGLMRMRDPDIVAKARSEKRIVLTFDLDFGKSWRCPAMQAPPSSCSA